MKVAVNNDRTHNPFDETCWASRLRENLTSGSYGEGLETGRGPMAVPRQPFTRQGDNKLDKSCLSLSEIGAGTGASVRALVHASLTGSIMIGLLAYHHRRRETKPPKDGAPRTTPPIHPQSLARAVGCAAEGIATAMTLQGAAARRRWQELADYLEHLGREPNWRRRPSVLDQLRGWQIEPGRPWKAYAASLRPHAVIGNAEASRS